MKILVLGAKGNLGTQLVKVFSAAKKYEVIGFDREDIDITDHLTLFSKINELKPAVIINAVAYNAVDKCEEDEEQFKLAKKLNGEAVTYLAEAALNNHCVLVHYSTDYVFEGNHKNGYKEYDGPNPINHYGLSKLLGEKVVRSYGERGLKYYLIRTSKLFGPKGEAEVAKPSFFDIMLNLAQTKDILEVVDEETSCFTYTPDLANATKELIEAEKEFGVYHIINSEPATWYEAVKELFKIKNVKIKVTPVSSDKFPRPAKRPKSSILLNTKLNPLRSYVEALKDYLK